LIDFDFVVIPAMLLIAAIAVVLLSIRYLRTMSSRPRAKVARALDLTILLAVNVMVLELRSVPA